MQKRTREILALALLGTFAVIGVAAMLFYVFVGHNWNVAATQIDDSIGQMDDYSVVLIEGTRQPQKISRDQAELRGGQNITIASDSSNASEGSEGASENKPRRLIDAIAEDYRQKGAATFILSAETIKAFPESFIASKKGRRVGFFSARSDELRSSIRLDAAALEREGVDEIFALSDDNSLADIASEGLVGRISVVVSTTDDPQRENEYYSGSTLCVKTPFKGHVCAILTSSSGVMFTKWY